MTCRALRLGGGETHQTKRMRSTETKNLWRLMLEDSVDCYVRAIPNGTARVDSVQTWKTVGPRSSAYCSVDIFDNVRVLVG